MDTRRRSHLVPFVALAAGVPILLFASLMLWGHRRLHYSPDLAEIARRTGVVFPPGTRVARSRIDVWLTTTLVARLEMSRNDVPRLVASLPPTRVTSRKDRLGITPSWYAGPPTWWTPEAPRRFLAATVDQWATPPPTVTREVRLLISLDDPHQATLYLFWCVD